MVPYANQQQSTDFTESTCTSRAGSKVRFIRPPEMAPPELATGPGHPDCHSENSPSLPGVTQSRSRKEKKSSSELPRVLHEDTLRSLEGQSSYNVRKIWTEKVSQFRSLRRFLAENQIEQELSHRVMRFLQHSLNVKKSVQSDDPQVLEMLSKPLQGELQLERHKATFEQNGFFRRMLKQGGFHPIRELRMVAMNCMQPQVMASGDVVFAAGSMANSCFFLAKGSFHYTFEKSYEELSNTWIAEMCLWIPWSYAGDLVAQETSRLFSLDLSAFCKAVAKVDTTREMAVAYAKECVDALNGKQGSVSDLWQSLSESHEVNPSKSIRSGVFSRILPLDMD